MLKILLVLFGPALMTVGGVLVGAGQPWGIIAVFVGGLSVGYCSGAYLDY